MTEPTKNTAKFAKGNPGKPKGAVNKNTKELKEMILAALNEAGGVEYLVSKANDPRTASAFLSLIGKVLPMQVTGANGGPVEHAVKFEVVGVLPS